MIFMLAPAAWAADGENTIISDTTWESATTLDHDLTISADAILTVKGSITVQGSVTVSGGGTIKRGEDFADCMIVVPEGSTLTLENITVDGGAVWSGESDATLNRGTVNNNGCTATSALIEVKHGALTLNSGAVIQNNERTVGTEIEDWLGWTRPVAQTVRYYAVGGGISVINGSLTVNDGAAVKNNAIKVTDKANDATSDALGGGIGLYDCASLIINGGEISGNQAQTSGSARAMGGGIGMVAHPNSPCDPCKVQFNGGRLENNLSVTSGGGAYFTSDSEDETGTDALDVSFSGGTVSQNKTTGGGGGAVVWGAKATLSDISFTDNEATDGNGGGIQLSTRTIVSITGGTYSNNKSKNGGGISWGGTRFEFQDGTVSNNKATAYGGGIHLYGNTAEMSAVISGGLISKNEAVRGAGVWADDLTLSGSTISGNSATDSGGGAYVNHIFKLSGTGWITENRAATGGGVYVASQNDSTFEITGGTISKNTATGSTGGGGIYYTKPKSDTAAVAYMENGTITENTAQTGAGGGLYLRGNFDLRGGSISKNSAPMYAGGGINVYSGAEMTMTGGTISENTANEAAGIRVAGTVTMNGGEISKNSAKPIYVESSSRPLNNNNNGGGVSVAKDGIFIMNAGQISNNTAKYGAGISAYKSKQFEIHGGKIVGNHTEDMTYLEGETEKTVEGTYGAGINLGGNITLLITGGSITENVAKQYGGGINVPVGNKLQISGTPVITENTANNKADNVYLRSSTQGISLIEMAGELKNGAVIGVKTEKTPDNSTNKSIQITSTETNTEYYKDAAQYFIPDAANVVAQVNESGNYVELAYTTDTYHKVTLDLSHASVSIGSPTTMVKNGESCTIAIKADEGYTLPEVTQDDVTYARDNDKTTATVTVTPTEDTNITITAVANSYKVEFNGNGNTSGTMAAQAMTFDTAVNLTANTFVRTDYNFAGWSTTKNGSCEYPDKASVKNLTAENGGTVTLYAIWTEKQVIPAFSSSAIQKYKYDGSVKAYTLNSGINGFTIAYKQGETDVTEPKDVGTYDVIISRTEDGTYAAFSQTITGGLVITAADYPVTIKADKTSMTGSGTVKLTVSNSVAGINVTGITCSDSSIVVAKNADSTYSATLPNETKTYTFTAVVEGVSANYGNGPATCTVSVTRRSSGGGSSGGGSSSSGSSYTVSVPSTKNGDVTVTPKNASKGDRVTITVKPDAGYVLETLTVTDKNGDTLKLTDRGNGKYTFTMPAGRVEVKATFMDDNTMLNFFVDVKSGDYYYDAVLWAAKNGITSGTDAVHFSPEQPCTRAQIVTFLWRAAGSPEPKGAASGMSDVVSGSYYEKAVAWAIENGITTGTTASTFSPDATCTRAQAVTFLARALNGKAPDKAEFSDVPADSYFAEAVAWALSNGVTTGIGGGLFAPDNDCTRAQIVTFLWRAYNK